MLNIRAVRPVSPDRLRENVRYAIGLGLPCVEAEPINAKRLHIYASGPSLKQADLQWPSMALNGALREFTLRRQAPTWWAACDPQALVSVFLHDQVTPIGGYLVASRCDKAVFDAVGDRFCRVWHLADEGADVLADAMLLPDAPSVTISALFLAHLMGFRAVTIHGWDGCYINDVSHADGRDDGKRRVSVKANGQEFVTNPSWLVEQEDARGVIAWLVHGGMDGKEPMDIQIAGNGMMATVLNPLADEIKAIREMQAA